MDKNSKNFYEYRYSLEKWLLHIFSIFNEILGKYCGNDYENNTVEIKF